MKASQQKRSVIPVGLRAVFRKQNKFRRQAYLWAVLISLPVIVWTLFLRFDILFWRLSYAGLTLGLLIAGAALLNPNIPLRWVERFVVVLNFLFAFIKYIYLVYDPGSHLLANWLGEIQANFWVAAIGFILAYIVFERKTALWFCMGQIAAILLITLPLLPQFSGEILREFFRLETRLAAIAFITLVLAKAKDDLLETQNRALSIESLAYLDPLTNLPNRRALIEMIKKRMSDPKAQLAMVVADIDFFKNINDTYGHETGDMVLRAVGILLKNSLREQDLVGRWGGEEFVIMLHGGNTISHMQTTERIRHVVESQTFVHQLRITCSFGGSDLQPSETFEQLFTRADQALYVAKSKGRNRTEWF